MAEYRIFERCIVCRSSFNLEHYQGEFKETLLINTLYTTVMFPIETRQKYGMAKSKKIVNFLKSHNIVDYHGNEFTSDEVVRYLRNALAHYNITVESNNSKVSSVKLWGVNAPDKALCKEAVACENPKCRPKQYISNTHGEICTFTFTVDQLYDFTQFVIEQALSLIPNDVCDNCEYRRLMQQKIHKGEEL